MSNRDAESPVRQEACWLRRHKRQSRGSTATFAWAAASSPAAGLLTGALRSPPRPMAPRRPLSWNLLLLLSLAFGLSGGTDEASMKCPETLGQLGSSVVLPLTPAGLGRGLNESIRIIVAKAGSPGSNVKSKIVTLDFPRDDAPRYLESGYKFHLETLSLEVLEARRKDEGSYTMTLEENVSVEHFCRQLKLYEQVSTPEIQVLNRTQEDGNCSLTLACTVAKGDHVAYSWGQGAGAHPLSVANGSHLLHVTLGPRHADSVYNCTASNPISTRSGSIAPWPSCSFPSPESRQWGLYAGLPSGGIAVVVIVLLVLRPLMRRGKAGDCQMKEEAKSLTIYAQVQKSGSVQKKPDALSAQDPCTTIYVAATEPAPEPAQEPGSVTIYASVTLPES